MAISSAPTKFNVRGLVWSIRGEPYTRRTRIELLLQGPYAMCLRENPTLRIGAINTAVGALRINTPVDTGQLRRSIRVSNRGGSPVISLGPEPYDRALLKSIQAGRPLQRRRGKRVVLSKYYALPANATSHRPEYIERSLRTASGPIITACRNYASIAKEEAALELAILQLPRSQRRR